MIAVPRRWTLLPGVASTDPERILSASDDIPVAGVRRTLAAQLVVIGALRTLEMHLAEGAVEGTLARLPDVQAEVRVGTLHLGGGKPRVSAMDLDPAHGFRLDGVRTLRDLFL